MATNIENNQMFNWAPSVAGQSVRLRANPGKQGVTTGRTKEAGTYLMVEVNFGPNETVFKRFHQLELFKQVDDMFELFYARKFGGVDDLRRILTYEKVRGDLTNIYYSMESSNTTFYPHQFKPVLKFIESPIGRLLIADEVGLGKTIEAMYIWKELQARHDTRRLLIVCPAMLREKWSDDLSLRFNVNAKIVSAKELLNSLSGYLLRGQPDSFIFITSLEGLRTPADYEDDSDNSARAQIARLLEANSPLSNHALLDLVIIDEAHYLRNVSTASNRLGRILRDTAQHLLLLTATPIHISSDNLYQLLRLIDQDEFHDSKLFEEMLDANSPIIRMQMALWSTPPDLETALHCIDEALQNQYFINDEILLHLRSNLTRIMANPALQVECARLLESRSLLSQYMTRTRKREIDIPQAKRRAQTLEVRFNDTERRIYDQISQWIRQRSIDEFRILNFSLIMRQRQMASSLVATLRVWSETEYLQELTDEFSLYRDQLNLTIDDHEQPVNISAEIIEFLRNNDSKFEKLLEFIRRELKENSKEKFVIFSYFRATIEYLAERLSLAGIDVVTIMGGMGETKFSNISRFRDANGSSVLLSSEVGTEGIDLQFCRILINYDLPWNPMRVEQRIGRIDRLGQESETVSIVNLFVADTVEDRILRRLYDRLGIFEESIGDLEEIFGEQTQELMLKLLDPKLSDEEREELAQVQVLALINQRDTQRKLEQEAVNLIGIGKYILENIELSRDRNRWISGKELKAYVDDFFNLKYPGTLIRSGKEITNSVYIKLSPEAQMSLESFIDRMNPAVSTNLTRYLSGVRCYFESSSANDFGGSPVELIQSNHPLVQWICHEYSTDTFKLFPTAAISIDKDLIDIPVGDYVYAVEKWSFSGHRSEKILAFKVAAVEQNEQLDALKSEKLVTLAERVGRNFSNVSNLVSKFEEFKLCIQGCEQSLRTEYADKLKAFEAENNLKCRQQETSARNYTSRKLTELNERLERFRSTGRHRLIPMTEGLVRREKEQLSLKLQSIEEQREVDPEFSSVAVGLIRIA